ncbi:MAG: ABC transporter permease [Bacteroidales bacterium]
MQKSKIFLITSREFFLRVRKRSFILMTILTPLLFASLMILPSLIMFLSTEESDKEILVIDHSQITEPYFQEGKGFTFTFDANANLEKLKKEFPQQLHAIVEISPLDSMQNVTVRSYSIKQLSLESKMAIEKYIEAALVERKIDSYSIENLREIIDQVKSSVTIKAFTLSQDGGEKVSVVEATMAISYISGFLIFLFIFIFGSMVMRGVIEEKSNRVVEVILSSVKPFELMMGKIVGVGLVAIVQFTIWIVLTLGIVTLLQLFIPMESFTEIDPNMVAAAPELSQNFVEELLGALLSLPLMTILLLFIFYFVFSYLLYGALFAAVGSAVDNESDTQQLVFPITIPLLVGLFIMIHTLQHPDSAISYWGSIIPFTSPMVMMSRIPYGVPFGELLLSMALLLLTFLLMVKFSAKIYRVGILMYGKKPSIKEVIKWIKY